MRYLIMMNLPAASTNYEYPDWKPEAWKAHRAAHEKLNDELRANGELVGIEALTAPTSAKLVRADDNGLPKTDGVFAETKEFLAGFWVIDVDSAERAYEVAARASAAPGPDGKPLNMPIEVREVMMSNSANA